MFFFTATIICRQLVIIINRLSCQALSLSMFNFYLNIYLYETLKHTDIKNILVY